VWVLGVTHQCGTIRSGPASLASAPPKYGTDGFGSGFHQAPFTNREALLQWKDDLAYTFGAHNLKMGFFIGRSRKREPANGGADLTAGNLSFNTFSDLRRARRCGSQHGRNAIKSLWRPQHREAVRELG